MKRRVTDEGGRSARTFRAKILCKLLSSILARAEPEDDDVYAACRRYVDRFRGENNDDMKTNGEFAFMRDRLVDSSFVVDVGANVGDWAKLALEINPQVQLHAFEPSRETYRRLLARGLPPNVVCRNFGLGSTNEQRKLFLFEEESGLNSLYKRSGLEEGWGLRPQGTEELVQIRTLDGYCSANGIEKIDYLKVDVEGHELEVFKGARRMINERRIRFIQFEYGGCNIDSGTRLKDIFQFFEGSPYRLFKIHPEALHSHNRYDQRLENYQYQNWALVLGSD